MCRSAINQRQVQKTAAGKRARPVIVYWCITCLTRVTERNVKTDDLTQCIVGLGCDKDNRLRGRLPARLHCRRSCRYNKALFLGDVTSNALPQKFKVNFRKCRQAWKCIGFQVRLFHRDHFHAFPPLSLSDGLHTTSNLGFVGPCIFTHSNESTNYK